jgi:hypothetical protein
MWGNGLLVAPVRHRGCGFTSGGPWNPTDEKTPIFFQKISGKVDRIFYRTIPASKHVFSAIDHV